MNTPDPTASQPDSTNATISDVDPADRSGSSDLELLRTNVRDRYKAGDLEALLEHEAALKGPSNMRRLFANIKSDVQLLRHGFSMPRPEHMEHLGKVDKKRVLYLLHNSLPLDSGGYATRTHGLLRGIVENGYRVSGVTRLGYPQDRGGAFQDQTYAPQELVNGIGYHRHQSQLSGLNKQPSIEYLQLNLQAHMPLVRKERPAILHGASNYVNGLSTTFLARRFGLKSIYEVRGLWELTRASREPAYMTSDAFRLYARMEAEVCNNADHVFALTAALKDIMIDRGVDGDKITLLPNGVDADQFSPVPINKALAIQLGIAEGELVIGYIGSIVDYEGLDDLILAFHGLQSRLDIKARLLIVGDGDMLNDLKALALDLNLGDSIIFTGRVPYEAVPDYYSLIDIAPFPRKPLPVTEAVSPLKPFEAMAMEICVLASNVAAFDEFVTDGLNGMTFEKGNAQSLEVALEELLQNHDLRNRLSKQSRKWVIETRDWQQISRIITDVYDGLLGT